MQKVGSAITTVTHVHVYPVDVLKLDMMEAQMHSPESGTKALEDQSSSMLLCLMPLIDLL